METNGYTICEEYTLPTKGLLYETQFDPRIELTSMLTEDEMRRLSPTDRPYKVMSDIIESRLITKLPIHVYDMCLGDYEYLLHKIRVVTYGPEYKMKVICTDCKKAMPITTNLDELKVIDFNVDEFRNLLSLELPASKHQVELYYQTPKMLDNIEITKKDIAERCNDTNDYGIIATLMHLIKTVDGVKYDPIKMESFVRKLPMRDSNILIQRAAKLRTKVGLDTSITCKCPQCGKSINTFFRQSPEFFGPTED